MPQSAKWDSNTTASAGQWKQLAEPLPPSVPGFFDRRPTASITVDGDKRVELADGQANRMTVIYDKLGVRLFYAEGWKVTEDEVSAEPRTLSIRPS